MFLAYYIYPHGSRNDTAVDMTHDCVHVYTILNTDPFANTKRSAIIIGKRNFGTLFSANLLVMVHSAIALSRIMTDTDHLGYVKIVVSIRVKMLHPNS